MRRVACLAVLLILAACGDRGQQGQAPAVPAAAPAPSGPLSYEATTPAAHVKLTLPERVGQIPALYAKLFSENRNALDGFAEAAVEDVESMKAAGLDARPYEREVVYAVVAETPRLLSLRIDAYENTGGAHPNSSMATLTWDKQAGAEVKPAQLFRTGADLASVEKALCDAAKAAKRERTGDDRYGDEPIKCPSVKDANLALAPSVMASKAGGFIALFSPYEIGPYVEGGYEVLLPLQAFQSALAPAFAPEFEGPPKPLPEGT